MTEFGIIIDSKAAQPVNALLFMNVTELGIVIDANEVQSTKA